MAPRRNTPTSISQSRLVFSPVNDVPLSGLAGSCDLIVKGMEVPSMPHGDLMTLPLDGSCHESNAPSSATRSSNICRQKQNLKRKMKDALIRERLFVCVLRYALCVLIYGVGVTAGFPRTRSRRRRDSDFCRVGGSLRHPFMIQRTNTSMMSAIDDAWRHGTDQGLCGLFGSGMGWPWIIAADNYLHCLQ